MTYLVPLVHKIKCLNVCQPNLIVQLHLCLVQISFISKFVK